MKKSQLITAAALAFAFAGAWAQTFDQAFTRQMTDFQKSVTESRLDSPIKADFMTKLAAIATEAKCTQAGNMNCAKSTPQLIEAAKAKLTKLSTDLATAIAEDGSKKVTALYQPKLDALLAKLNAGKVDGPEVAPLKLRIQRFFSQEAGKGGQRTLSQIEADYQKLVVDVDAAISLSADSKSTASFMTQSTSLANILVTGLVLLL